MKMHRLANFKFTMRRFVVTDVSVRPIGPIYKGQAVSFTLRRKPERMQ